MVKNTPTAPRTEQISVKAPAVIKSRKASRPEAVIHPLDEQRQAVLQQIGQELQQARQKKSLSLEQLHNQTWIPIHQLKALEAGQVEHLPEDIYVRGFIRRIGDALGLNGEELAALLPVPDSAKSVIPSWARSNEFSGYLRPTHLYLGYAALMVGAMGGLTWFSQQAASSGEFRAISTDEPAPQTSQRSEMRVNPGTRMSENGAIAHPDATAPDNLRF